MKKTLLGFALCFAAFLLSVCSQKNIDKDQYAAIDPFDYKLDEKKAERGAERQFKSVVQYRFQNGTVLSFFSLDQGTALDLTVTRHFNPPSPGQVVTIYYTATKRIIDSLVLDEIDYRNNTEEGINLVKSIFVPPDIDRDNYQEIDPFDYKIEAEHAQRGDTRKYKSTMLFSAQNGITYYFISHAEGTLLSMKAGQRFPPLVADQQVTVYYTATKGIVDSLSLDDIEL